MARDDDFEERKRRRDEEDEEERNRQSTAKPGTGPRVATSMEKLGSQIPVEKLDELFKRAEPLIEQLNNKYTMYIAGVDNIPPLELRKQLDNLMTMLLSAPKPTNSYMFRFQTLQAKYQSHRDKWDRQMKDIESGKIKRITGPKRGG